MPFLHTGTRAIDELGHVFGLRWLEDEFAGPVFHDVGGTRSESSCAGGPIARHDSVVETDEEFSVPSERRVVCSTKDETHGLSIPSDEGHVLFLHFRREVPG
jgi:hypothetical protein